MKKSKIKMKNDCVINIKSVLSSLSFLLVLSFPRRRESSVSPKNLPVVLHWIPAFAGMTKVAGMTIVALSSLIFNFSITKAASTEVAPRQNVSFESLPDNKVFNDFVVGPGKIELELAPGQSGSFELTIANRLGTDKTFSISEEDFSGSDDPSKTVVLLGDDRGPQSLKDYLKISTSTLLIPHGIKSRIKINISIPENAQPGGLYGSVIVGTVSRATNETGRIGISTTNPVITRIGTLVFIRVKGLANESGQLTKFVLGGNRSVVTDSGPIAFHLLFKNNGNVHLNPRGTIIVNNLLGSVVGKIVVEPWFAMPGSLRFREVTWSADNNGEGSIQKPAFLFGRYVAHASIDRGYGEEKDEMSTVFWVIPWQIVSVIIICLAIVIGIAKWLVRRRS